MKAPQRLSEMVWKHVWLGSVSLQLKFGSKLRISSDSPPAKQRGHCLAIATWDMDAMWNDVRDQVVSWKMARYGKIWPDMARWQIANIFVSLMEKYWLGTMKGSTFVCMRSRFHGHEGSPAQMSILQEPPGGLARLRRCGALVLRSPQSQVFLERVAMTSNWDDWSWWLPYTTHDEAGDGGSYEHYSSYTRFVDVGSIIESSQPWWWGCQPRSRGFALWVLVRGRDPKTAGLWSSELWATGGGLHILLDRWRTTKLNMKS